MADPPRPIDPQEGDGPGDGPRPVDSGGPTPGAGPANAKRGSGEGGREGGGPVPVRDLMKTMTPEPEAEGEPRWEGDGRSFEVDGEEWVVRPAGAGTYGTGGFGTARLLAVHFFRKADAEDPVREALVPAGVFPTLRGEELRTLFERATPIVITDDQRREG